MIEAGTKEKARLRYCLLNVDCEVIGNMLLDGADMTWVEQGNHEFVQFTEVQYLGLDNEPRDIKDCPLYLVVLVQWDPYSNVASRLGLGRGPTRTKDCGIITCVYSRLLRV